MRIHANTLRDAINSIMYEETDLFEPPTIMVKTKNHETAFYYIERHELRAIVNLLNCPDLVHLLRRKET